MALADADFALRFDMGDGFVWVECDRRTCYAYLQGREGGVLGNCWLFNLVDAPEMFQPIEGEPPVLDLRHSRPFDLDGEVDPQGFLVTGGEFEGRRAYEIWYSDRLVGVLAARPERGQSAYATVRSRLVKPLDRSAALGRHFARTAHHLRRVLEIDGERLHEKSRQSIREMIEYNEFGLAADELRPYEPMLSPESLAELEKTRLVRGEMVS